MERRLHAASTLFGEVTIGWGDSTDEDEDVEVEMMATTEDLERGRPAVTLPPTSGKLQATLALVDGLHFDDMTEDEKSRLTNALLITDVPPSFEICRKGEACDGLAIILTEGPAVMEEDTGEWTSRGAILNLESLLYNERFSRTSMRTASKTIRIAHLPQDRFDQWRQARMNLIVYKFPILRDLPVNTLATLGLQHSWYDAGQSIKVKDVMLLITHGVVHVQADGPHSRLCPGHVLGTRELMCGESCEAVAEAPVGCASLHGDIMRSLMSDEAASDFIMTVVEIAFRRSVDAEERDSSVVSRESNRMAQAVAEALASGSDQTFMTADQLNIWKDSKGQKHLNQYILNRQLGKGATATVVQCEKVIDTEGTTQQFAMKIVRRKGGSTCFHREVEALRVLRHANIIALEEVIDCPNSEMLVVVQECAEWGSLLGVVFTFAECKSFARECLQAVSFMHSMRYIHGDIKPANLLRMADGTLKIADFGCCIRIQQDTPQQLPEKAIGTPAFMAPEVCNGKGCTPEADVWALTATIYCLIFGKPPFMAQSSAALTEAIMYNAPSYDIAKVRRNSKAASNDDVGDDFGHLVHLCNNGMAKFPASRLTIPQMASHPWIAAPARRTSSYAA